MTTAEQRRAWVLTRVMAGELGVAEAAGLLGLSARSVWRLKRRFGEEGPAGLVHGNRGRASSRRILALLEEAIELCGVPHELMTDNGTPFVAIVRTMLSRFQRSLADLRIRHTRTQIDTPWTNGKDRGLLGDPPGRGPRPPAARRSGRRRGRRDGLRRLLQLPPPPR